jgi:hypothetical protein
VSPLVNPAALGQRLYVAGFQPLPAVNLSGKLIGTRLWRVSAGYVECLALGKDGLAHAVRAEATFDYPSPADHGPVVGHRFGTAHNALDWLLDTQAVPHAPLARPYVPPSTSNSWRTLDDRGDDQ